MRYSPALRALRAPVVVVLASVPRVRHAGIWSDELGRVRGCGAVARTAVAGERERRIGRLPDDCTGSILEHELRRDRLSELELALVHAHLVRGVVDGLEETVPAVDDLQARADERDGVVSACRQGALRDCVT